MGYGVLRRRRKAGCLLVATASTSITADVSKLSCILGLAVIAATLSLAAGPPVVLDVTLWDLTNRSLEFANRHVRVTGTIHIGYESFILMDDRCGAPSCESAWLSEPNEDEMSTFARGWSTKRFLHALKSGQLMGEGPDVEWQAPAPVSALDPQRVEAIDEALERADEKGVRFLVTGRYDYAGDGLLVRQGSGRFSLMFAYGHLNCCPGRIVLQSVQVVEP